MTKFSDSNYDILEDYFTEVGTGVGTGDSWLLGPKKGIVGEGGVAEILWEDNATRGFVAHKFIIQSIEGNNFYMAYDGLVSTHSLASSAFEIGNDFYFRKDSFFYEYLVENTTELRDFINTERTFCYFGKIWPVSNTAGVWNIEFLGMKDYMQSAIPVHNRTARLTEMMDVWFDQINHEPYNMTKYLWALLDAKEVDVRWLDYIASIYGIDVNIDLDELTLREWVDYLVYFLKRIGTYNAIYIVYKVFTALSENKLNVYERWEEWCQRGAGDIPSFKEFPNFFPGTKDFHWLEYYGLSPSGGAGSVWYDQFEPSGAPTPNPYIGIEIDPYPTHALTEPSPSCSSVSAAPTGSMVISPHYIVEVDLTTEPIGDRFDSDWILNQFYADELVRNWEYARPVNKYVQYQQLIAPAVIQDRSGEPANLYPLTSLGYFNTTFTGSALLSSSPPTPSGGETAFVYTQYGGSANWTVDHDLDSDHIMVQVWAPVSGPAFYPLTRVIPNNAEIMGEDILELSFDDPISGIANIAGYVPGISDEYDQVAPTNPWSVIHNLGTAAASGYPVGSVVNYFTSPSKAYPASASIIDSNRTNATWDAATTGEALTRNADYVHTQTIASDTWGINHGMNTDGTIIQCFDSSDELIQPKTTILTDADNLTVTFESAQSGTAYLIYFKRSVIGRINDDCDITGMGICAGGIGYWKVGDGTVDDYNPYITNDLQSETASGNYWRVWQDSQNFYIDFIVPTGENLTIREVGLFNINDELMYYSVCSELYKPEEVQTVFHYESQQLRITESSSSSSSSTSSSSSSSSLSSSSSSSTSSSSESSSSSSSSISSSSSSSSVSSSSCSLKSLFGMDGQDGDPFNDWWEVVSGGTPSIAISGGAVYPSPIADAPKYHIEIWPKDTNPRPISDGMITLTATQSNPVSMVKFRTIFTGDLDFTVDMRVLSYILNNDTSRNARSGVFIRDVGNHGTYAEWRYTGCNFGGFKGVRIHAFWYNNYVQAGSWGCGIVSSTSPNRPNLHFDRLASNSNKWRMNFGACGASKSSFNPVGGVALGSGDIEILFKCESLLVSVSRPIPRAIAQFENLTFCYVDTPIQDRICPESISSSSISSSSISSSSSSSSSSVSSSSSSISSSSSSTAP